LVGAPLDECRADQADPGVAGKDGRPGAEALLVVDDLLHQRGAAPAVLDRPRDADPPGLVHRALPLHATLEGRPVRRDALVGGIGDTQVARQVVGKPAAELLAQRILLWRVLKVHGPPPRWR